MSALEGNTSWHNVTLITHEIKSLWGSNDGPDTGDLRVDGARQFATLSSPQKERPWSIDFDDKHTAQDINRGYPQCRETGKIRGSNPLDLEACYGMFSDYPAW
jgi:hypothetical protein